jgi:Fic family protein
MALVDPEVEAENKFEKFLNELSGSFTREDVEGATGFSEATSRRYIAKAVEDRRVTKSGRGKNTEYRRKKSERIM